MPDKEGKPNNESLGNIKSITVPTGKSNFIYLFNLFILNFNISINLIFISLYFTRLYKLVILKM